MNKLFFLLVISFAVYCVVGSATEEAFESFIAKYNKKYAGPQERKQRFENFKASLKEIEMLNKASPNTVYAITKFADMTHTEFSETVLMRETIRSVDVSVDEPIQDFTANPPTFDWRDKGAVSAIKNQGDCGSCWAFSATEAIESANILAGKVNDSINLSPQQIVDCDHDFVFGCGGGRPSSAYGYIVKAGGQEGMDHYPYTAKDGKCAFDSQYVEAQISGYTDKGLGKPETSLQNNLVSMGPLSICLEAAHWMHYSSGTITKLACCPLLICELDHCVQLVGYNTTATMPYWIVRNSWGTDWGMDGYIQIEMGSNVCGLTDEVSWPTV